MPELGDFEVEVGKRKCKCKDTKCKQGIDKGNIRAVRWVKNPFGDGEDDLSKQFYHVPCLFRALTRARKQRKNHRIRSAFRVRCERNRERNQRRYLPIFGGRRDSMVQ
eukprot:UN27286